MIDNMFNPGRPSPMMGGFGQDPMRSPPIMAPQQGMMDPTKMGGGMDHGGFGNGFGGGMRDGMGAHPWGPQMQGGFGQWGGGQPGQFGGQFGQMMPQQGQGFGQWQPGQFGAR